MIRVLIVEDSPVVRELLSNILGRDPEIALAGIADSGEQALEMVRRTKPDVITMDVHMPGMDGFDATRRIMETWPTPIVIVSGIPDATSKAKVFRALEAGALAVLQTPHGVGHQDYLSCSAELVRTVKLMSEIRVVKRWPRARSQAPVPTTTMREIVIPNPAALQLIAIGASTGGPPVIHAILSQLPEDFPIPIVVVQHIANGFTRGFAEWLGQSLKLRVEIPEHGQQLTHGRVYVAPDGLHMTIGSCGRVLLNAEDPENGLRPSVSRLFRSVAETCGRHAIGVLLTGMGKDGAWELKLMKERGAVTIAQDRESCVVHGMPGEAIRIGAATHVLSPEKIRVALATFAVERDDGGKLPACDSRDSA
jgi:two-component system chemotaxis response regulator CheB